jgi:hypothetical protein
MTCSTKFPLAAEKLGQLDVVERHLRRLIALKPDSPQGYNALGYTFADHNIRLDEAAALVDKALSLSPDDSFILDSKGWVLFRQGKLDRRPGTLQRAYAKQPDAEIAAHIGEVLWQLGRQGRGQNHLDRSEQGASGQRGFQRDHQALPALMLRRLVWLVALLALAACAELGPTCQRARAGPGSGGRASSSTGAFRCVRAIVATICNSDWQHAPGQDVVLFSSPLGQGLAELGRDAGGALAQATRQAGAACRRTLPQLAQQHLFHAPAAGRDRRLAAWRTSGAGRRSRWLARHAITETSPYRQRRLLRVMEGRRGDVEFKLIVDGWDAPDE